MKIYRRQYKIDGKWSDHDDFDNLGDLYVETDDMWPGTGFALELDEWCEKADVGDIYEDDDIRIEVIEGN